MQHHSRKRRRGAIAAPREGARLRPGSEIEASAEDASTRRATDPFIAAGPVDRAGESADNTQSVQALGLTMFNSNSVPIDEAAVHAELAQLAGGEPFHVNGAAPASAGATPPGPTDESSASAPLMDWSQASAGLVLAIDKVLVPNWELESEEKDALAAGISLTLSAFFPTINIDPRVQALLVLGTIVSSVAAKRVNMAERTVVPFRKPKPKPESAADAADAHRAAA